MRKPQWKWRLSGFHGFLRSGHGFAKRLFRSTLNSYLPHSINWPQSNPHSIAGKTTFKHDLLFLIYRISYLTHLKYYYIHRFIDLSTTYSTPASFTSTLKAILTSSGGTNFSKIGCTWSHCPGTGIRYPHQWFFGRVVPISVDSAWLQFHWAGHQSSYLCKGAGYQGHQWAEKTVLACLYKTATMAAVKTQLTCYVPVRK